MPAAVTNAISLILGPGPPDSYRKRDYALDQYYLEQLGYLPRVLSFADPYFVIICLIRTEQNGSQPEKPKAAFAEQ